MSRLPESMRALVAGWAEFWETPGLEDELDVTFSPRLKRSLGRCRPAAARVTLRADLRDGSPERLAEVLCHEVAHVAAYRKHGPAARAHGPEWRRLVTAAGFEPRARVAMPKPAPGETESDLGSTVVGNASAATEVNSMAAERGSAAANLGASDAPSPVADPAPETSPRRLAYEHRCPVCHTVRYARRPVPRWRCAECLDAGLGGEMVITRRSRA